MKIELELKSERVEVEKVNMEFDFSLTNRGFALVTFKDDNRQECSLQKSSVAYPDMVWLGVGDDRMHLNQHTAAVVVALLAYFVQHGELPTEQEATETVAQLMQTEPEWETT